MTYAMTYLILGLLTFWPMLLIDEECHRYVTTDRKSTAMAWALWCVVWLPSLVVDGLFWLLDREA